MKSKRVRLQRPEHKVKGTWHWDGTHWNKATKPALTPLEIPENVYQRNGKKGVQVRIQGKIC